MGGHTGTRTISLTRIEFFFFFPAHLRTNNILPLPPMTEWYEQAFPSPGGEAAGSPFWLVVLKAKMER